jgi:hypothetical protein
MSKKEKNTGQPPLPHIQQAVEDAAKEQGTPAGMPTLAQLRSECALHGLADSDAQYLHDRWAMNGFKTGRGRVRDFKAAIRVWISEGWFPSQKKGLSKDERDRKLQNEQFKKKFKT